MKKLLLLALASMSVSAFADHDFAARGARWQVQSGVPGQYCSSGIREGDICTVGAGYTCKVNGWIWQCNYRGGAVRVQRLSRLPSTCSYSVYEGGSCSYRGQTCTTQDGNWILACR